MKRYQIMIDGAISSQSFCLDELLELGVLDEYDDKIKVRATDENIWYVAREYPFHLSEKQNTSDNIVNDDGTGTRKKELTKCTSSTSSTHNGYSINEYGQVVRFGNTNTRRNSRLKLSTDSLYLTDSGGGSRSITVTSDGPWSISRNSASWVHLSQSNDTLTVRIDANSGSEARTDYFKIKSGDKERRVNIYQSGSSTPNTSSSSSSSSSSSNGGCSWGIWAALIIGARILYHLLNQ